MLATLRIFSYLLCFSELLVVATMQDRDKVWVTDPKAGFVLGRIVEFAEEGPVVQPIDRYIHFWFVALLRL